MFTALASSRLRISALGLAMAWCATPALAEQKEGEAREETETRSDIVVLGTRSTIDRTLSSDPATERMSQSSRSLEQDVLQAAGTYRLNDALELVSGFSQQNNRGGVLDNFAIRGFLGTPDGGAEFYVDGFIANRGMVPPRDPATVERIEVLKGPAGAIFGDIDPGGRVNIVSKVPRFAPAARATITYGSFNTRRAEIDSTGPLSDSLAARIVVAAEDSDGWRDTITLRRRVVSPSLTWRPSDAVRLTYLAEFMQFDTPFDRGIPAVGNDANALPRSNYYGEPSNGLTRFRNERHQVTGLAQLGDGWTLNGGIVWRTGSLKGFSADQSRIVGTQVWRQRRSRDFVIDDLAARMELAGRIGRHQVSLGLKGYRMTYGERWMRRNPSAASPYAVDLYDPASSYGGTTAPLLPFTNNDENRWAGTVYVQDMWAVTDRLTLVGGARVDPYRQKIVNNQTGGVGRIVEQPVKFRAGARYAVDDHVSVHANWGESFLLNSGTGRTGEGFQPEEARGYEVGIAGRWAGLDVGMTWFDISKSNILTTDPVDPGFNAPVGQLNSRGIEADASLRLGNRWQVIANYSWVDARNDDKSFATPAVLGVPEHSGTVLVVHRLPFAGREWQLSGGVAYVGDRAGSLDAQPLVLPEYAKAKAAIEAPVTDSLRFRLEADNLFDARYAASSYSRLWIYPGAPRTVRASLRLEI
ncbi:TonB-dependent siderophore receptor [Sphingomonas sp. SORGH_AS_0879]|uniref:TonB-dependent siderophore receptor n=1 Tax=Sphingomonas sp. SORGH_AS_0879 TaxID=3041790 RepID=UPI0027881370|nr:TonB-dependent siderophore receptor [Sphingomonas sp. SORGH_AS_0879]MDQ1230798.1 iron complex outermembrane receptor protein [Sphingomonas sp. SORGH_AS_0879]